MKIKAYYADRIEENTLIAIVLSLFQKEDTELQK